MEIVTDQRLLDFSGRIVDFQQQQKAPQSSILSCIRLAENCLFSRGWILKIFVCSANVRRICTSLLICVFLLGQSRANMCLGFCCSVGEASFESGQEGRKGGGKARVSLFLDAISSPSSYPCQSVHCSGSVSE